MTFLELLFWIIVAVIAYYLFTASITFLFIIIVIIVIYFIINWFTTPSVSNFSHINNSPQNTPSSWNKPGMVQLIDPRYAGPDDTSNVHHDESGICNDEMVQIYDPRYIGPDDTSNVYHDEYHDSGQVQPQYLQQSILPNNYVNIPVSN